MTKLKNGFSTTLNYWNLPRYTDVELRFDSDHDTCLFVYSSMTSIKLGSSIPIKLSSPILELIREKAHSWKFKGTEHHKIPSRDFYYIIFKASFSYPDLVKILEKMMK